MGLLDGILSTVLGGSNAAPAGGAPGGINADALMRIAGQLLQQHGGVGGLVDAFTKGGLGQAASSWVSTGANQPVSADQVSQVLGSGQIGQIAAQLGLDHGQASGILAQFLPQLVDHLTPNGAVPPAHSMQGDLMSAALGMLKSKLG
jgi:uncharacterized protein YidB (DUF937 family)